MKFVLITGSNGGLGSSLAKRLLELNYFVILHYHKKNNNVLKIHEQYKNSSYLLKGDISSLIDCERMKNECYEKKIKVDILINNAAIEHTSEVEDKTDETFLNIFKVNTLGVFHMTKLFGSEATNIINISSDNTIDKEDPVTMEYDVSKSGVNILTQEFALYYPNKQVNAICFGWLDTPMNDYSESIKNNLHFIPINDAINDIIELINTKETGKIVVKSE